MAESLWSHSSSPQEPVELINIQRPHNVLGPPHSDSGAGQITPLKHEFSSTREINQEDKFPNGGYGWVCVFCVFWINVCTWGISSAYGIFLAHYLSTDTFVGGTPLQYAFIAGLSVSQSLLLSPLITTIKYHTSTQTTLFIGVLLQSTALIGASFSSQIWHLFLSTGLCFGWGMGFFIVSTVGIIPQWFSTKRSLANGIATSGVGVGGIIFSLGTSAMIQAIGLAWTWRVLATTSGVVTLLCTLLIRDRNKAVVPNQTAFDVQMFRRPELCLFIGWGFFSELGYVVLWFSLPAYASSIGLSAKQGSVISALLNFGIVAGRPIIGYLSDRKGRINIATLMTAICGVLCLFMWVFAKGFALLCLFAVLAGMVCGTFWGTIGPIGAEVVGLRDLPNALNLTFLVLVAPATFAEAIALKLRRQTGDIYLDAQLFTGIMFIAAAVCAWFLRSWKVMQDEQDLVAKRRREDPISHDASSPVRIMSSQWIIQLMKGLISLKEV